MVRERKRDREEERYRIYIKRERVGTDGGSAKKREEREETEK